MSTYDKLLEKLTPNTRISYKRKLDIILRDYPDINILINDLEFADLYIKKTFLEKSGKETAWTALAWYVKSLNIKNSNISEYVSKYTKERLDSYETKEQHVVDLNDILPLFLKIKEDTFENLRDKLLLDFFINYPPLRTDIFNVKISNNTENNVYYNGSIYIDKCVKTGKRIRPMVLNDYTKRLLSLYIPLLSEIKPKGFPYLIYNGEVTNERKKNPNYSRFLSNISKKHLGEFLSINDFRKSKVLQVENEVRFKPPSVKFKTLDKLAKDMGHCYKTQQISYNVSDNSEIIWSNDPITLHGHYSWGFNKGVLIVKDVTVIEKN